MKTIITTFGVLILFLGLASILKAAPPCVTNTCPSGQVPVIIRGPSGARGPAGPVGPVGPAGAAGICPSSCSGSSGGAGYVYPLVSEEISGNCGRADYGGELLACKSSTFERDMARPTSVQAPYPQCPDGQLDAGALSFNVSDSAHPTCQFYHANERIGPVGSSSTSSVWHST